MLLQAEIAGFNFLLLLCNQYRNLRMTVAIMHLISKSLKIIQKQSRKTINFEKRELQQNEETSKKK